MQPPRTIAIRTCHRVEFYAAEPFELPVPTGLAPSWHQLVGTRDVLTRLATVAIGADSRILGETFVADQCRRPFLKTSVTDLPFGLIDKAFAIAARLKDEHQFVAALEYEKAAFRLLDLGRIEHPRALVVFGGGLLGQHIAGHVIAERYDKVFLVTRDTQRCAEEVARRNLRNVTVRSYGQWDIPAAADCVIAVHTSAASCVRIESVLRKIGAGRVVDFSAERNVLKTELIVRTMYDSSFIEMVDESNSLLKGRIVLLRAAIGRAITQLVDEYEK